MERDRLYFKDERGVFRKLPNDMAQSTEAKYSIEGISDFKERHLAFGDAQIPDMDSRALETVLKVNEDWKATHVWIMGDMINASTVSKYGYPADYERDLASEILEARGMLKEVSARVTESNPDVKVKYLEGNHENRVQKYMDKHARELAMLTEKDGDKTVSVPRLLGLAELGIEWVPYWEDDHIGEATILHGNIARIKGGYTGHAYIDKYGRSTVAGHSHRLAMIFRTQSGDVKFAIETGSLCKRDMVLPYVRADQADWQQGLALIGVDKKDNLYPATIPIIDGRAGFGMKIYDGRK